MFYFPRNFISFSNFVFTYFVLSSHMTLANKCENVVNSDLVNNINSYQEFATKVIKTIISGDLKGKAFQSTQEFTENFGARISGSEALEKAIDNMYVKMKDSGLENVRTEEVPMVDPYWIRGQEKLTMLSPRNKTLTILGLGYTVPTPPEGITAPVFVVRDWDDLKAKADQVKDKILVINYVYSNYSTMAAYRLRGAVEASKLGAKAILVRSVAKVSIQSPHTGMVDYEPENAPPIPSAALSVEDAQLLENLQNRGSPTTVHLLLQSTFNRDPRTSRNLIGELVGKSKPEENVILSCHIDSWDVGDGAIDDGGGCILAIEAIALLNKMGFRPKRTLKAVLFTAEEQGYRGSDKYVLDHEKNLGKINIIMEPDHGFFSPNGLIFCGAENGACVIKQVLTLLKEINATELKQQKSCGGDTNSFTPKNVPACQLLVDEDKYLWYHHTQADVAVNIVPEDMDTALAIWTVVSYVAADMEMDIPRA